MSLAPFVVLAVGAGVGFAARWAWRRARPGVQPVGASIVTTIEWFPDNDVGRLRGIVVPMTEQLVAPLTGRACVGYEVTISESANDEATEVVRDVRWTTFALDDGTGRATIDLAVEPVTMLLGTVTTTSGLADDATTDERAVLARHRQLPEGSSGFNRSLTYRERAILVGELISVRGHGVREADPSPAAATLGRVGPPTRLRLVTTKTSTLAISALPADLND